MAWIKFIDEAGAKGDLKKLYEELSEKRGKVANIMRIQSLNPEAMKAHIDLYLSLMFTESGLTREQRELIGTVVSAVNNCQYCVQHHALALNHYWQDEERLKRFFRDYKSFELPDKERKMLDYAIKLTTDPHSIIEEDIRALHRVGFSDEDILNINMIISYFNFTNRIALGLGVKFTPEEVKGYKY
jgi:uncharacterized peroxidase-related enzyme